MRAAGLVGLLLVVPVVAASGVLDTGYAQVRLDNGHDADCIEDITGLCAAESSGEALGEREIDARQRVRFVGVATNNTRVNEAFPIALLPDEAVFLDSEDFVLNYTVIRLIVETVGTQRGPGPADGFAVHFAPEGITYQIYGPSVREQDPEFGERHATIFEFHDGGVGYERSGPFGEMGEESTDFRAADTISGPCLADATYECRREYAKLSRYVASETPNAQWGLEFRELAAGTSENAILREEHLADRAPTTGAMPSRSTTPPPRPLATSPQTPLPAMAGPRDVPGERLLSTPRPESTPPAPTPGDDVAVVEVRAGPPSSSVVAAAAAGLAVVLLFAALYARITRGSENLVASHRARILSVLEREGGPLHYAALARALGVDRTTIRHHLRVLSRSGLVIVKRIGQQTLAALPGQALEPRPAEPTLAEDAILRVLAEAGGSLGRAELRGLTNGIPARTRNHILARLAQSGVVERELSAKGERIALRGAARV